MYGINIIKLKAQNGTTRQNMMPSCAATISIFLAFRACKHYTDFATDSRRGSYFFFIILVTNNL